MTSRYRAARSIQTLSDVAFWLRLHDPCWYRRRRKWCLSRHPPHRFVNLVRLAMTSTMAGKTALRLVIATRPQRTCQRTHRDGASGPRLNTGALARIATVLAAHAMGPINFDGGNSSLPLRDRVAPPQRP